MTPPQAGKKSFSAASAKTSSTRSSHALAYVDAQNDYADKDRTGAGKGLYAQRIISSAGKKDGLYWPDAQNSDASPLGRADRERDRPKAIAPAAAARRITATISRFSTNRAPPLRAANWNMS